MYQRSTGCRDRLSIDLRTESMPELEPGKTPCFGYAEALVGCFVGSTFASWSEA